MILETIILPPEIIDGIIALGMAFMGWLTRLLTTKKKDEMIKKENEKMKEIIIEYDSAAREALKSARRPQQPKE